MKQLSVYYALAYLCGLFLNASLVLIVLLSWAIDDLPFWFRLLFAIAPFFFTLVGYYVRKDSPDIGLTESLRAALLQCGVMLIPGVALALAVPDSVLCWFVFPVAGDFAAAFGSIAVWKPLYSILGAVGAPLLFFLGTLLYPALHPEKNPSHTE